MLSPAKPDRLLAIYLNDHLAGAKVGLELARRLQSSNEGDAVFGAPLARVCEDVETDREILEETMVEMGVSRGRLKPAGAWIGEKLGRLKLNGRLTSYSPLSRMVELELLYIGMTGQTRMWSALEHSLGEAPGKLDFGQMAERVAGQRDRVEELHLKAAAIAFPRLPPAPLRNGTSS